jgi:peptide/nickel transport system ATP-binding protein
MAADGLGALLLDIQHLSVDYGVGADAVHAVDDVSLTLRRGEVLGLAGESGSGKSTLAYAITSLLRSPAIVTGGRVLYHPHVDNRLGEGSAGGTRASGGGADDPIDILRLSAEELRLFRWDQLAIVFQSAMNSLNPVLTVGAQIEDVLRAHRSEMSGVERTRRAAELLQLVGISADRVGSYPYEMSGGMRQRAGIAIALALSPDIIIMDEPTTALDVVVQREILAEILRLRERLNLSVIFITHDLSLLLELADTIAIMYAGRMVELATRRELYQQPRHPYSYGLINSFPTLRGPRRKVTGIPGSPPDLRHVPPGCAFHPRCPFAFDVCERVVPALMRAVSGQPQQVACHLYDPAHTPEPPTLADMAARYEAALEKRAIS